MSRWVIRAKKRVTARSRRTHEIFRYWLVAGLLASITIPSRAGTIAVTLNTSGLPAGDYLFDFQFINGDAVTGNNTATISGCSSTNLTLGTLSLFGTASGSDLMSGVTLIDGSMTEVDQAFTAMAAAANISFMVILNTPARFADAVALGNYLARIRSAQFAASWASARASWGAGSSSGGSTLGAIMYRQWQARGGGGGPRNNGAPPTH